MLNNFLYSMSSPNALKYNSICHNLTNSFFPGMNTSICFPKTPILYFELYAPNDKADGGGTSDHYALWPTCKIFSVRIQSSVLCFMPKGGVLLPADTAMVLMDWKVRFPHATE